MLILSIVGVAFFIPIISGHLYVLFNTQHSAALQLTTTVRLSLSQSYEMLCGVDLYAIVKFFDLN